MLINPINHQLLHKSTFIPYLNFIPYKHHCSINKLRNHLIYRMIRWNHFFKSHLLISTISTSQINLYFLQKSLSLNHKMNCNLLENKIFCFKISFHKQKGFTNNKNSNITNLKISIKRVKQCSKFCKIKKSL